MMRWLAIALLLPALCWAQDELNSESGLVGRWLVPGWQTGNGAVPTLTVDLGQSKINGQPTNSPQWLKYSSKQAMRFGSSTNQYISLSKGGLSSLNNNKNGVTLTAWVYWDGTYFPANIRSFVQILFSGGNSTAQGIGIDSSGSFRSGGRSKDTDSYQRALSPSKMPSNRWCHVAGVFDYSNKKIYNYIDGIQVTTSNAVWATNIFVNSTTPTAADGIGADVATRGDSLFYGYMADVRVYSRAVSAAEIKSIYEQGLAPK